MAAAGADAIGLNFFAGSPRHVTPETAAEVVGALPPSVKKVGVFVNATCGEIQSRFDQLRLDLVQLHGDEPPEFLRELGGIPVMRALRCAGTLAQVGDYLRSCRELGCLPDLVLIDAHRAGQYGGTGQITNWALLVDERDALCGLPLVLAGGLTPKNVAEAIATVRPAAVDTASGVELSPGKKSASLTQAFVAAAKSEFNRAIRS